jgi:hypothetical protein
VRFERSTEQPLVIEIEPEGDVTIHRDHPENAVCSLGESDLRWLMHVGIPAALDTLSMKPSESSVEVVESDEPGQIKGQLAIK